MFQFFLNLAKLCFYGHMKHFNRHWYRQVEVLYLITAQSLILCKLFQCANCASETHFHVQMKRFNGHCYPQTGRQILSEITGGSGLVSFTNPLSSEAGNLSRSGWAAVIAGQGSSVNSGQLVDHYIFTENHPELWDFPFIPQLSMPNYHYQSKIKIPLGRS